MPQSINTGGSRSERRRNRMAFANPLTIPLITGTPGVGNTLTASPGTWAPAGSVFTYQWIRGDKRIAGATAAAYTMLVDDRGKPLSCLLTATHPSVGKLSVSLNVKF